MQNYLSSGEQAYLQLQALFNASLDMICSVDRNGCFVSVSRASKELLGYEPHELVGVPFMNFVTDDYREATHDIAKQIMAGLNTSSFENAYRHRNGNTVPMIWSATWDEQAGIMYCVGRNNSERKMKDALEQEARAYQQQLFDTLEQMALGFFSLDRNLVVTYFNRQAESFFNVHRADMIGKVMTEWYCEEASKMYKPVLEAVLERGQPFHGEQLCPQVDRWVEASIYPSKHGLSVFFKDIHERKMLELEVEQQQKRISRAVIAAQERERTQVSRELHDNVNQVLTSVKLYQELCLSGHGDCNSLLMKSAGLLQNAINEIRGLSRRLSAPTLANARLKETIAELAETVMCTQRFQLLLDMEVIEELEVNEAMHLALYRILQEHLTNILKYANASRVEVAFDFVDGDLILTVTDNGCGFDTKQKRAGLGIANMRTRAESLNGTLHIDSTPGAGCVLMARFALAA